MQNVVGIRGFRRRVSESIVRVGRGETVVVVRHGRPVAIMRPAETADTGRRISVTTFRGNLRRALAVTRRRPLLLTWYGESAAILEAPPDGIGFEIVEEDLA
jgi:antitoxin (DNA-binding transcriptional repressor) of toxin-antitoxin stability system